jgi:hypothetical protein
MKRVIFSSYFTRDFMEKLWGLIDVISCSGGKATIVILSGSLEKGGSKDPLFLPSRG